MYAAERHQQITVLLAVQRRLSVAEVAETFGVTTETVRRDFALLEHEGLLRRVHGGAVPPGTLTAIEAGVAERDGVATAEKDAIARAALALLPGEGGSILLDAGTTVRRLAAQLATAPRLIAFTNAPAIAPVLAAVPQIDLQLIGGRIRQRTQAVVGPGAVAALSAIRVDVAFIGTNGISLDFGFSTPDSDEAAIKSAMVAAGRQVVVLADSSKFDTEYLNRFAQLGQVDVVVTDGAISARFHHALEDRGVDVVIA